jgi:hypothetical protein
VWDFHATFFTDWLRFVGITDVIEVRFQPTVLTATAAEDRAASPRRRPPGRQGLMTPPAGAATGNPRRTGRSQPAYTPRH